MSPVLLWQRCALGSGFSFATAPWRFLANQWEEAVDRNENRASPLATLIVLANPQLEGTPFALASVNAQTGRITAGHF